MKFFDMEQKKEKTELLITEDGYLDVVKKIGTNNSNQGFFLTIPSDEALASIYTGDGMAKKYLNLLCDDMTRAWINIQEDTDGEILDYLEQIDCQKTFKEAIRGSKLFGGSIIFMVIDDGKEPEEPVNITSIKSILKLKAFDRTKITIDETQYYSDLKNSNFGEPQYFTLQTDSGELKKVHESRCLVFKGDYYPPDHLTRTSTSYSKFWGISVLTPLYKIFEKYGISILALFETFTKLNVDVLTLKNLMALLKTKDGENLLKKRIEALDYAKSITNTIVLDSDEQYQTISQQLNNVADTFSKLEQTLSAQTGIASTIFFGTSAKGLNSTGDNEVRIYYDKISAMQKEELTQPLKKIINYVLISKDYKGDKIEKPKIIYNSLWQMTEKEIVEMRNKQADTDVKYIDSGVVDPNEIRKSRFGNDNYSIETSIDGDELETMEPESDDEANI